MLIQDVYNLIKNIKTLEKRLNEQYKGRPLKKEEMEELSLEQTKLMNQLVKNTNPSIRKDLISVSFTLNGIVVDMDLGDKPSSVDFKIDL